MINKKIIQEYELKQVYHYLGNQPYLLRIDESICN
jgi:hypothetical protein